MMKAIPDPASEVLARGVIKSRDFIQEVMVQTIVKRCKR